MTMEELRQYAERIRKIFDRIHDLQNKGYFIELVLWYSQLIENELLGVIASYDRLIGQTGLINKNSLQEYMYKTKDVLRNDERYTLGQLIKEFEKRLNKNNKYSELIINIRGFQKTRNTVIHKLFDQNVDLSSIENKIIKHLPEKDIGNHWLVIAYELSQIQEKISKEEYEERKTYLNGLAKMHLLRNLSKPPTKN